MSYDFVIIIKGSFKNQSKYFTYQGVSYYQIGCIVGECLNCTPLHRHLDHFYLLKVLNSHFGLHMRGLESYHNIQDSHSEFQELACLSSKIQTDKALRIVSN